MGACSARMAEPALDTQLEAILGDLDTLTHLLDAATREAAREASATTRHVGRRLTQVENRRQRVKDAYVEGDFDLAELRKRTAAFDAEKAELEAHVGTDAPVEIDHELVADLVEVFASWRDLKREDKRALLRDYRAEIVVETLGGRRKRWLRVDRLRLGVLPPHLWLYKKMKRFQID